MGCTVALPNSYIEVLIPVLQNVTIFGNRFFEEISKLDEVIRVGHPPKTLQEENI